MLMNNNEYIEIIETIKGEIRGAQYKAALSVNRELIMLYYHIGTVINEHFSYIQTNIEKRIFAIMLDHLSANEQLIFTTHSTDMLDLNLPNHSFAFLRRSAADTRQISVLYASDILKRNTDSIRCAAENDVFSSLPDDSLLDTLEKGWDNAE